MALHATRAAALLSWVNSLQVAEPVTSVLELQDCNIFIQIINRIHGTEEGQQILQQPLLDRFNFISSFLQKNRKHQSSSESLVSVQKLEDGEELELAKVIMLLLYHSTMSSKSLRDWNQFDYKIQAELAAILKFVLDHEDGLSLNDSLKSFLQKAPVPSSSPSTSSDELSPVPPLSSLSQPLSATSFGKSHWSQKGDYLLVPLCPPLAPFLGVIPVLMTLVAPGADIGEAKFPELVGEERV